MLIKDLFQFSLCRTFLRKRDALRAFPQVPYCDIKSYFISKLIEHLTIRTNKIISIWVRFPPRSKDFLFTSCGSLIPLLGLTPSGSFLGSISTLQFSVPSFTLTQELRLHNIYYSSCFVKNPHCPIVCVIFEVLLIDDDSGFFRFFTTRLRCSSFLSQ